ncbi:hypothetical protein SLEP1_g45595 [Rubroshorea leprosula]|uniref:Uncharacterized protein n=1 Tax=Rubroshorea leprosula TaxID=152421 RepID=A0AAV5LK75_9ROSI|nr:hypothetical protein SLEP1_g45595 [Rubroshorea leprosula]
MGREMATESWFGSLRWTSKKGATEITDKGVVGILAVEVAGLMSKVVNLWHCLEDKEITRLREEIVNSIALQKLVSGDHVYLMDLVLNEIMENFGQLARYVARLGKRCTDPKYHRFEHFLDDPHLNNFEWIGLQYRWKKMERKVKKMRRFISHTMQLTQELEVLAELEQTLRRMQRNSESEQVKLFEFQQKVLWQRQEVRNLREMSPWVRTYDYVVRLLVRSLLTILARIKHIFGTDQMASEDGNNYCESITSDSLSRSLSFSAVMPSSVYPSDNSLCGFSSGPLGRSCSKSLLATDNNRTNKKHQQAHFQQAVLNGKHPRSKSKGLGHVGPFKGCISAGGDSPVLHSCRPIGSGSMRFTLVNTKKIDRMESKNAESFTCNHKIYSKLSIFNSKQLSKPPPSTLGGAAVDIRYAKVIILIEKLVLSPHLIDLDTRDDLYNMLSTSLRNNLQAKLKSFGKTLASYIYDPSLAAEWNQALERILEWLAPLAHNMIRWQSERNFEEQHVVSRSNTLLVQTLHYADQEKTEAVITELLVGLNYVCRVGRVHNKSLSDSSRRRADDGYLLGRDSMQ